MLDSLASIGWVRRHNEKNMLIDGYAIEYHSRRKDVLFITFDHLRTPTVKGSERVGWGSAFFEKHGFSAIHVKPDKNCWYRKPALEEFFVAAQRQGVFKRYRRVITYGGSMGGFGALSFAKLASAHTVISMNPQVHLGPSVREWEDRFQMALTQDWTGSLCDINEQISAASKVVLVYDPYFKNDRKHIDMLNGTNLIHLKVPFVRHHIPAHLRGMNLLAPLLKSCARDSINVSWMQAQLRKRRELAAYRETMIELTADRPSRQKIILETLPPAELGSHPQ